MNNVFQCRMRQPHPTQEIGLFLSLYAAVASDTEKHCSCKQTIKLEHSAFIYTLCAQQQQQQHPTTTTSNNNNNRPV
jgi:hypothetical protein